MVYINENFNKLTPSYLFATVAEKRAAYEAAADLTVATDGRTPEEIAEEILRAAGHLERNRAYMDKE